MRPRRRERADQPTARIATVLAALGAALSMLACDEPPPPPVGTPRLAVVVVVDQMRYDYLERTRPLLRGGLARLLAEGASFTAAHHAHALTLTGPGHATLATGTHPAHSGIVANSWLDRASGEWAYCVSDPHDGTSPRKLRVPALGDWLKWRYPRSKVFAAAGKDRSAVLLGGKHPDGVFWYDDASGDFVTSDYYGSRPPWLADFDATGLPGDLFARGGLRPLPVDPRAAAAAGFEPLDRGPFDPGFPRPLGGFSLVPDDDFWGAVYDSPFADQHLGRLAREIVVREQLGADEWPDLLALGFSSLDAVGHEYGPNSPEALDVLLRLDRTLGELFDLLDRRVGKGRWVAALSADHGVAPLPESAAGRAAGGHRGGAREAGCLHRAGQDLARRFGRSTFLGGGYYLDRTALAQSGLDAAQVERLAAQRLAACPGVAHVWTGAELASPPAGTAATAPGDPGWFATLYRHSYDPERSPDLFVQAEPYELWLLGSETTHGSPYPYDTHVPFVVAGPGIGHREVAQTVFTVDFAPTLAALLAVPVPEVDGVSRWELLHAARPTDAAAATARGEGSEDGRVGAEADHEGADGVLEDRERGERATGREVGGGYVSATPGSPGRRAPAP